MKRITILLLLFAVAYCVKVSGKTIVLKKKATSCPTHTEVFEGGTNYVNGGDTLYIVPCAQTPAIVITVKRMSTLDVLYEVQLSPDTDNNFPFVLPYLVHECIFEIRDCNGIAYVGTLCP